MDSDGRYGVGCNRDVRARLRHGSRLHRALGIERAFWLPRSQCLMDCGGPAGMAHAQMKPARRQAPADEAPILILIAALFYVVGDIRDTRAGGARSIPSSGKSDLT
jgi:hypothetical protein